MRTLRTTISFLTAASVLALPLMAAAAPIELTFRFNDAEQKEMREALDVFEQQSPNIKVTLQRIAWGDSREQFLREAAVGQGPDVVHIAQTWTRSMGQAGVFAKLNELVKRHGLRAGWDDFLSTELAVQDDGTIYAIPWTVDTFAMVYNTDILKQAGIARFPETWEELGRRAARSSEDGEDRLGVPGRQRLHELDLVLLQFLLVVPRLGRWWTGCPMASTHGDHRAPDRRGFRLLQLYLKEGLNDKSMLAVTNWGAQELIEGMVQGNFAMISTPEFVLTQIEEAYKARFPGRPMPFASTIHPKDKNGSKTFMGGRQLAINVNTKYPDEAFKLVQYLTNPEIFTKYYVGQWPAQNSRIARIQRAPSHSGYPEQLKLARQWGAYSSRAGGDPDNVERSRPRSRVGVRRGEDLQGGGQGACTS